MTDVRHSHHGKDIGEGDVDVLAARVSPETKSRGADELQQGVDGYF